MKPDAFEIHWHGQSDKDNVVSYDPCHDDDGTSKPLYSAATIRKWLLECSDEMWSTGMDTMGGTDDKYRAMIALKLEELADAKSHTKKMSKADVLLRQARLCLDPFKDPDMAEEIDDCLKKEAT